MWQHRSMGAPWDVLLSRGCGSGETLAVSSLTCRQWGCPGMLGGCHTGGWSPCRIFYLPLFLLLLAMAHGSTARILVKLALRNLGHPATAKPAVEDVEKACKVELCTEGGEDALSPGTKWSSGSTKPKLLLDTAMSLTQEDTQ